MYLVIHYVCVLPHLAQTTRCFFITHMKLINSNYFVVAVVVAIICII